MRAPPIAAQVGSHSATARQSYAAPVALVWLVVHGDDSLDDATVTAASRVAQARSRGTA